MLSTDLAGQSITLRASSPQGPQWPESVVSVAADGTVIMPVTPATTGFTNTVRFFNASGTGATADNTPFQIDWQISNGNLPFATIGSTKHTVYVTAADPLSTANTLRAETLFNIGCRNGNLIALDILDRIPEAIWAEFADRDVQRVIPSSGALDGRAMTYYGGGSGGTATCQGLLANGNGACGAWAAFMIDVLRAQGLEAEHMVIKPKIAPQADLDAAITLRYGAGWPGDREEPLLFIREYETTDVFAPIPETGGIPAQGNPEPVSLFNDHSVVKYMGSYYDPSYGGGGQPYHSLKSWEDAALEAIGHIVSFSDPSAVPKTVRWVWKMNSPASEECEISLYSED